MMKKRGIGLSVELVVILFVMVSMLAFVIAGVPYLMRMSRVNTLATEVKGIQKAASAFIMDYGYFPGDIPKRELPIMFQYKFDEDFTGIGCTSSSTSDECKLGNKFVGGKKTLLATRQMVRSGVDSSYTSVNYNETFNKAYKKEFFIQSGYKKNNVYAFLADTKSASPAYANSVLQTFGDYEMKYSGKLRAVLFDYSGITDESVMGLDFTKSIASVSADDMSTLDAKIDDGNPSTGSLIAEDVSGSTTSTCASGGGYVKSSNVSGDTGCIVTVVINEFGDENNN